MKDISDSTVASAANRNRALEMQAKAMEAQVKVGEMREERKAKHMEQVMKLTLARDGIARRKEKIGWLKASAKEAKDEYFEAFENKMPADDCIF